MRRSTLYDAVEKAIGAFVAADAAYKRALDGTDLTHLEGASDAELLAAGRALYGARFDERTAALTELVGAYLAMISSATEATN